MESHFVTYNVLGEYIDCNLTLFFISVGGYSTSTNGPKPTTTKEDHPTTTRKQETTTKAEHTTTTKKQPTTTKEQLTSSTTKTSISTSNKESKLLS